MKIQALTPNAKKTRHHLEIQTPKLEPQESVGFRVHNRKTQDPTLPQVEASSMAAITETPKFEEP